MEEEFNIQYLESLPKEAAEFLSLLDGDDSFAEEIELFIENLYKFDIAKIHEQIMAIIESSMQKLILKEKIKELLDDLTSGGEGIKQDLKRLQDYLEQDTNIDLTNLEKKASRQLILLMKNFIIYEIYKILSPRRIAGTSLRENFISNFLLRGEKVARKFEGGSKKDIAKYGKGFLAKLKNKKKKISSGGGGIFIGGK